MGDRDLGYDLLSLQCMERDGLQSLQPGMFLQRCCDDVTRLGAQRSNSRQKISTISPSKPQDSEFSLLVYSQDQNDSRVTLKKIIAIASVGLQYHIEEIYRTETPHCPKVIYTLFSSTLIQQGLKNETELACIAVRASTTETKEEGAPRMTPSHSDSVSCMTWPWLYDMFRASPIDFSLL